MEYAPGQCSGFYAFFEDGRVGLSKTNVENAIRPVAPGRKNYMFKGSEVAPAAWSDYFTAKLNG